MTRKYMTVAMCFMALTGFLFLGWTVVNRSGMHSMSIPIKVSRSITMRSPGAVFHSGSDGPPIRSVIQNCARGYVRRGSVCEADTTHKVLSAASNVGTQSPIPAPLRE